MNDKIIQSIKNQFQDSAQLLADFGDNNARDIYDMAVIMAESIRRGGKLLIAGNGGSAADSQHFAAELIGRLHRERPSIAAIALTTDTSILTAVGNDYGFEQVFRRQVLGLGTANDVFIPISTSGNSKNLVHAVEAANENGMPSLALLGKTGGTLAGMVEKSLIVPADSSQFIQQVHITVIHAWCEIIEDILFPIQQV
jgi:D-sedoheptulose 7-phosphate isomerase